MGMDLVAIIDHNRNAQELLQLPELICSSKELKKLFCEQHNCEIRELKTCQWKGSFPMTKINIETIWIHLKNEIDLELNKPMNYYTEIDTYFGNISVYEKTINISPFPEHKYRNLRNLLTSKYIFKLNRIIASLLGSNQIVYCCDSYYYPEIIESKSMDGWNNESIIKFGNKLFGQPPSEINEAVENLYFIDNFDIKLDELDPEKEVWSRAKYEYEKEQKGENPYEHIQ